MCTDTIVKATIEGAAAGSVVPIIGTATGAVFGAAAGAKKEVEQLTKTPKVVTPKPPADKNLAERQARFRELRRTLAGRPGRGRGATFATGTGTGPTELKQKTGQ